MPIPTRTLENFDTLIKLTKFSHQKSIQLHEQRYKLWTSNSLSYSSSHTDYKVRKSEQNAEIITSKQRNKIQFRTIPQTSLKKHIYFPFYSSRLKHVCNRAEQEIIYESRKHFNIYVVMDIPPIIIILTLHRNIDHGWQYSQV